MLYIAFITGVIVNKVKLKIFVKRNTLKSLTKVKLKVKKVTVFGVSGFGTKFIVIVKIIKVKLKFAFLKSVTEVILKNEK